MDAESKILLLGCGYVLERVAKLAPLAATDVIATTRRPARVAELVSKGIKAVSADLSNPTALSRIFEENRIGCVVDSIPPLAVDGGELTKTYGPLIELIKRHSSRAIYLSTTGVYGRSSGELVSESDSPAPATAAAERRLMVENIYHGNISSFCAVRIPAIYGPGRGIGTALKAGRFKMIEDGERWSNRVQVDDLAATIALLTQLSTLPSVLNAADSAPAVQRDVVDFYCEKFALPKPGSMTLAEAKTLGMDTLLGNQRISNQLLCSLKSSSGQQFTLRYPSYKEGAFTEFA